MGTQPPPDVIAAAQTAMAATGIPASVTLAQWALESAWGRHMPLTSNNPFGIKAVNGQPFVIAVTHEVYGGVTKVVTARFAKYPDLASAFKAHAGLLAYEPQYSHARACLPNVTEFCDALTGVYATDPSYGDDLTAIIDDSDLTQYDTEAKAA